MTNIFGKPNLGYLQLSTNLMPVPQSRKCVEDTQLAQLAQLPGSTRSLMASNDNSPWVL